MNLLMLGHSYVVALNRRLCRELATLGKGRFDITVAAPAFYHGDLRPHRLEREDHEPYRLEPLPAWLTKIPQGFFYSGRLRGLLHERRWDLVHAWEEPYIVASAQVAFHTPRESALVFSSFQNQPKRYPPPFDRIERYCLARCSAWTAFGQSVDENLRGRPGYGERASTIIPPGVDVETFRPDPDGGRKVLESLGWSPGGPPIVGFLGRFVPPKGIELLLRVLDRLEPGTWRALWVGGGPLEPRLREWGARHGDRVRVVTGVPHDGVPAYLNAMDVLAAPSQTTPQWKEQFGRMLVEAMAVGLPIIASDSGEIPYVVADVGRIVGEADEPGWEREIKDILARPELRRDFRERGLARAHEVYAWPVIARKYLDFFEQLLDRRGRGGDRTDEANDRVAAGR
jgi:glycosyltransferase involved in cell wall biosynthesis